ncbi:fatty acid desaturase [bacterium]|nr:fatty acid desaturase [bacterium]
MSTVVLTPVTQALRDGALTRRELKQFMKRSDKPALLRLLILCVIVASGIVLIRLTQGSWLVVPTMFLHGVVLVHLFSLQHECCHYTAFKTRWLNDWVGNVCGLIIMLPNRFFRYEHCDHHTYTQIKGKDTELIEMPRSFSAYLGYLSSIPYWKAKLSELWRHAFGRLTPSEKRFVPFSERCTVILEARFMAGFYATVIVLSVLYQTDAALWYWFLPVVLGEPVMRAIRMTEHVGRPMVSDMTTNTRSNKISEPMRFLCWNMNYHAEHHYAASVPFHALPALSKKLDGYVHTEKGGYLGAHRDIISQLSRLDYS